MEGTLYCIALCLGIDETWEEISTNMSLYILIYVNHLRNNSCCLFHHLVLESFCHRFGHTASHANPLFVLLGE